MLLSKRIYSVRKDNFLTQEPGVSRKKLTHVLLSLTIFCVFSSSICDQDPYSNILRLPCKQNAIFYRIRHNQKMNDSFKISEHEVKDDNVCMRTCLLEPHCKSISAVNIDIQTVSCSLYSEDRHGHLNDLILAVGHRYYDSGYFASKVGPVCRSIIEDLDERCVDTCTGEGYTLDRYRVGGSSCQNLRETYKDENLPNGLYCMAGKHDMTTAYCDMANNGGGWVRIGMVRIKGVVDVDYTDKLGHLVGRKGNFILNFHGVESLINRLSDFTQFRFYCKKDYLNRRVNIVTNSSDVFKYFTQIGQPQPAACQSFEISADDSSYISQYCMNWRSENDEKGFWYTDDINRPFRITDRYEWAITNDVIRCDDVNDSEVNGEWMIFVR